MGYPLIETGIKINDIDLADINPSDISKIVNSDSTGTFKVILENEIAKQAGEIGVYENDNNWYGKEQGRPKLSELPYMESEGDGYPRLPGHIPGCDGIKRYGDPTLLRCYCEYHKYNKSVPHYLRENTRGVLLDDLD